MLKYCNRCGFETLRNNKEEENNCPYHQEVMHDEEGGSYLKYEEFNQDGEEW
tara:strand:+ start:541 stop:696 length:156 start_codon:yes stop_codon:yes gene_type:complete